MNLEELIKKYLGEWLTGAALVRIEYYSSNANAPWMVSFYSNTNELTYSTEVCCAELEKGLEIIRERLQKG